MWQVNVHRIVVLFSGGVESTCLLYMYLREGWLVYPVYVKAGYPWEALELENGRNLWLYTMKVHRNLMPLRVVSMINPEKVNRREHNKNLFIPLRNMSLVSMAGNYALLKGIRHVAIGSLGIYPFPDNNADYMKKLQSLMNIELLTPFMGMEKHEVLKRFSEGVPLERTLSCIRPKKLMGKIVSCGKCEKCRERQEAFTYL
ncbi:MAG: 7-cyano-7-deazaguanine synthase [Aquificaceae bacterium]